MERLNSDQNNDDDDDDDDNDVEDKEGKDKIGEQKAAAEENDKLGQGDEAAARHKEQERFRCRACRTEFCAQCSV